MRELAHRHEQAEPDILRRHPRHHFRMDRLVVRADRPDEHLRAVQELLARLPLHRIGADRGRGWRELDRVLDLDPGVEREQPRFTSHQRVDIERPYGRVLHGKRAELHQAKGEALQVDRGLIAVAFEKPVNAGRFDEILGELEVERRKRHRGIADGFDRGSARAEQDDWPEGRIGCYAQNDLQGVAPPDPWLNRDALELGVGPEGLDVREHLPRHSLDILGGFEVQPHAADVRFVRDVRRQDFHHQGRIAAQQFGRGLSSLLRRRGDAGRHGWDAVGFEHGLGFRLGHELPAFLEDEPDVRLHRIVVEVHLGGKRRRRLHEFGLSGAVTGELNDAPDRGPRRHEVRYFRFPEKRLHLVRLAALQPASQDRLRGAGFTDFRHGLDGRSRGVRG